MKRRLAVYLLYFVIVLAAIMIFSTLLWVNLYAEYHGDWSNFVLFRRDIVVRTLIQFIVSAVIAAFLYYMFEHKK